MRALGIMILLLVVAGCSIRGGLVRVPEGVIAATERPIFFATNRGFETLPFGGDRNGAMNFGKAVVSIPPIHEPGEIEWPRGTPSPEKHFLLAETSAYPDANRFRQEINASLARAPRGERDVVIYIHGFNTRFADGIYRLAQITHDMEVPGVPVHYSWPSAGNPLGYAYDRDSALFARDDLEKLLITLQQTNAENVIIVAHSLGSLVTMETLRQMRLRGGPVDEIDGVVLMSPDVDLDVFKAQARRIAPLPRPFLIFSSENDRALRLVERLTGQNDRLGRLQDVEELADFDITFIDVTAFSDGDPLNHFTAARSPALLQLLSKVRDFDDAFSSDDTARSGLLPGTVLTVQNATRVILTPRNRRTLPAP